MQKKKNFSGNPGDCSEQQLQALDKFRATVKALGCDDPRYNDAYLLRFLRARKFDHEKTLQMWQNHTTWRKERNVEETLHMKFPDVDTAKQFYPHGWLKTDKLGRPIFIERVGKLNLDKLLKTVSVERLQTHYIHGYEKLLTEIFPACSKAKGEPVNNTCYIMDMKGAAAHMMSSKVWDLLKMTTKIGQDYYPEILGTMFIINAPMFFYGVWNIVKHFVDEKTRNKIHILGSGYKKELFKVVDENNLPDFLGGKLTENDYGPNLTKEQGPWISLEEETQAVKAITLRPAGVCDDKENMIPSLELIDKIESSEGYRDIEIKSVPIVGRGHNSIEELGEVEHFDIGQESPLKIKVKNFRAKPSMSFTKIPSLNGSRGFGI
jgi:hypothetical protein